LLASCGRLAISDILYIGLGEARDNSLMPERIRVFLKIGCNGGGFPEHLRRRVYQDAMLKTKSEKEGQGQD